MRRMRLYPHPECALHFRGVAQDGTGTSHAGRLGTRGENTPWCDKIHPHR